MRKFGDLVKDLTHGKSEYNSSVKFVNLVNDPKHKKFISEISALVGHLKCEENKKSSVKLQFFHYNRFRN